VGDAWDVLSGVDYLVGKGWIDEDKMARKNAPCLQSIELIDLFVCLSRANLGK
jgi:hypothetical protein